MRTWTLEARAAQRAVMQRLKPWTKSTGPRTAAGKKISAANSLKTGLHSKPMQKLRKVLRDYRSYLKFLKTNCYDLENGDSGWARTSNPLLRRQVLYPVELRNRFDITDCRLSPAECT